MKVSGLIAGMGVDLDGQVMDRDWLTKALDDFKIQHPSAAVTIDFDPGQPAGTCESITMTDEGPVAVVDVWSDKAERLIRSGALRSMALSIRKAVVEAAIYAPNGVIRGGTINNISLVSEATHIGPLTVEGS